MIYALLTLASALSISVVAAYFSIIGLATIFPGSIGAVIAMGTALEIGKIIAAVWLHRNWKTAPFLIKTYLVSGVIILMGITSMGIFGFLSKSHIEHKQQTEKAQALVMQIQGKIDREQSYINRQKQLISQAEESMTKLNDKSNDFIKLEQQKIEQINKDLDRDIKIDMEILNNISSRIKTLNDQLEQVRNKSVGLFTDKKKLIQQTIDSQSKEREQLTQERSKTTKNIDQYREKAAKAIDDIRSRIEKYQSTSYDQPDSMEQRISSLNKNINESLDKIDQLSREKFELGDNSRQLEAEVGPIKYVIELIGDMTGAQVDIEDAVRWMIIVLMVVFDPLAILLVIAAHISLSKQKIKWSSLFKRTHSPVDLDGNGVDVTRGETVVEENTESDDVKKNYLDSITGTEKYIDIVTFCKHFKLPLNDEQKLAFDYDNWSRRFKTSNFDCYSDNFFISSRGDIYIAKGDKLVKYSYTGQMICDTIIHCDQESRDIHIKLKITFLTGRLNNIELTQFDIRYHNTSNINAIT